MKAIKIVLCLIEINFSYNFISGKNYNVPDRGLCFFPIILPGRRTYGPEAGKVKIIL